MNRLSSLLREWWSSVREQVALIAFTHAVLLIGRWAKPELKAVALRVNEATDKKFGDMANVVQRETAQALRVIAEGLEA